MALKGTLKDFGIADIFQLISHQSKTGILVLRSKEKEVRVSFLNGDVVRAETAHRRKQDLLGTMLVRAELITEQQLAKALDIQKLTLKRLGDVMTELGFVPAAELRRAMQLQTTETLYMLFNWETGTYAFEPEEITVEADAIEPIRSENILMEGFRMVDEWPMVRKKITSYDLSFKKIRELAGSADRAKSPAVDPFDAALDNLESGRGREKGSRNIGENEHKVFALIEEGRTVGKIIDLARLGEFETCKALFNLLNEGAIKVAARRDAKKDLEGAPGERLRSFPLGRILIQAAMYAVLIGLALLLYKSLNLNPLELFRESSTGSLEDPAARGLVEAAVTRRIRLALEIFRLERGQYPAALAELVEAGLLRGSDLRFPWRQERLYKNRADSYLLLRPFE